VGFTSARLSSEVPAEMLLAVPFIAVMVLLPWSMLNWLRTQAPAAWREARSAFLKGEADLDLAARFLLPTALSR